MRKMLPLSFYGQPTLLVARGLLGKYLVHRYRGRTLALMITEVEAYDGLRDKASHASRGRTPRNRPMFRKGGIFYVYFTYGMHWLVNIVTGPEKYPAAVLLRAGAYKDPAGKIHVIHGPARLTRFLKIGRSQNGKPSSKKTGLWIEDRGMKIPARGIIAKKRVGVDYAGAFWANKKYNFTFSFPLSSARVSHRRNRTP